MSRTPVAFIAWTATAGRSAEIASSLGGEAKCVMYDLGEGTVGTLARYLVSSIVTVAYLLRCRPRAVIVTNPPIVPGLIALLYGRVSGTAVVLDSHAGSFGLKGDNVSRRLLPVHAFLARRCDATLVASEPLARRVAEWAGRPLIVREAPRAELPRRVASGRPHVVFVGIFEADEPVEAVVAAAAQLADVDVTITGDLRRRPHQLAATAPANVRWSGFLTGSDYEELLASADTIMALTTEPTSALRAGFEAVYVGRPLITSDWPLLRQLFPSATFVGSSPPEIAAGVRASLRGSGNSEAVLAEQRERQLGLWSRELAALQRVIRQEPDRVGPTHVAVTMSSE